MADNYIQDGDILATTNGSGTDVDAGGVLVIGDSIRVAVNDIAKTASGEAFAHGVFELPATTADNWADGDVLYWDASTGKLTDTAASNTVAGHAVGIKAVSATYAQVSIIAGEIVGPSDTAVTAAKIAADAVITAKILDDAVTAAKLAAYKSGAADVEADTLAIPVTHAAVNKTTGADAEALTLANGTAGQVVTINLAVDGNGTGTLTPATCTGFTTIAFADAGDTATLMYIDNAVGWIILGTAGIAAPPAIAIT